MTFLVLVNFYIKLILTSFLHTVFLHYLVALSGGIYVGGAFDEEFFPSTVQVTANMNKAQNELSNSQNVFSTEQEISICSMNEMNFISVKYPDAQTYGIDILTMQNQSAAIHTNNTKGDPLFSIGETKAGHGGVFLYDKYGESYTSYSFNKNYCFNE